MAPAVLRMGEHVPYVDLFAVVMNRNDQSKFVSRYVEHGKISHLVCGREGNPQFGKKGVIGFSDDAIPVVQRNPRIGMFPGKFDQPFSRDDMQTLKIISRFEIAVKVAAVGG